MAVCSAPGNVRLTASQSIQADPEWSSASEAFRLEVGLVRLSRHAGARAALHAGEPDNPAIRAG